MTFGFWLFLKFPSAKKGCKRMLQSLQSEDRGKKIINGLWIKKKKETVTWTFTECIKNSRVAPKIKVASYRFLYKTIKKIIKEKKREKKERKKKQREEAEGRRRRWAFSFFLFSSFFFFPFLFWGGQLFKQFSLKVHLKEIWRKWAERKEGSLFFPNY